MSRLISDRMSTVGFPTGTGPAVITLPLHLPDQGNSIVDAWIGNPGVPNVYLLSGVVSLVQAQSILSDDTVGTIDCLMVLADGASVRCPIDDVTRALTVFLEAANASGETLAVTVRVRTYES